MTRVLRCASVVTMLGILGLGSRAMTTVQPELPLDTSASSTAELVQRLLEALERRDLNALHRLRVTEPEYKGIILAGGVPVGQPFRSYRAEVSDLAWQTLNTKSIYYERFLLHEYGGRRYELKDVRFEEGTADYAGYRAHRQLRLSLAREGSTVELATGSIAEVGGRFKFVSFIRD